VVWEEGSREAPPYPDYASNKGTALVSEKNNNEPDKNAGIRRLINSGVEIAGGAVGGALGFLAGDPAGAWS